MLIAILERRKTVWQGYTKQMNSLIFIVVLQSERSMKKYIKGCRNICLTKREILFMIAKA